MLLTYVYVFLDCDWWNNQTAVIKAKYKVKVTKNVLMDYFNSSGFKSASELWI